jgi:hypothetical protein
MIIKSLYLKYSLKLMFKIFFIFMFMFKKTMNRQPSILKGISEKKGIEPLRILKFNHLAGDTLYL